MTEDRETEDRGEEVIFDAELTPHRSLPPEGFVVLMLLIGWVHYWLGYCPFAGCGFYP